MSEASADYQIILNYFPQLTKLQQDQFAQLKDLYSSWNSKINVISRKDIDHLYERHVLHSLGIGKIISFKSKTKTLDIGTGGGFPGIPLAIMFPESDFHLVDSIGKKINVVKEVVAALNLKNVKAEQIRVEDIKEKYDFIVSRAVADFSKLYNWTRNIFSNDNINTLSNGLLCLKGGDVSEELKDFQKRVQVYELQDYFKEEFFETKKVIYLPINK